MTEQGRWTFFDKLIDDILSKDMSIAFKVSKESAGDAISEDQFAFTYTLFCPHGQGYGRGIKLSYYVKPSEAINGAMDIMSESIRQTMKRLESDFCKEPGHLEKQKEKASEEIFVTG